MFWKIYRHCFFYISTKDGICCFCNWQSVFLRINGPCGLTSHITKALHFDEKRKIQSSFKLDLWSPDMLLMRVCVCKCLWVWVWVLLLSSRKSRHSIDCTRRRRNKPDISIETFCVCVCLSCTLIFCSTRAIQIYNFGWDNNWLYIMHAWSMYCVLLYQNLW